MGDPSTQLEAFDQAIQHVSRGRYRDHKHRDHILATDDSLRRSIEQALAIDPIVADIRQDERVGDARTVRGQIKGCDERLQTIRRGLTLGNGWFERFNLTRRRRKPGAPTVTNGPYLKYRWREGTGSKYTISMGLIPNAGSGEGAFEGNESREPMG